MTKLEQIEDLMKAGFEAVNDFDTKVAIKIGKKLKKLRHTSAFEILALAYLNEENSEKAIKILKEGVDVAPKLWILWQLLGNTYSDINKYDEAQKCYQKALECEGNDGNSILYNSALAYARTKDKTHHEEQIDRISVQELHENKQFNLLFLVASEKVSLLIKKGALEESRKFSEKYINIGIDKYEYRTEYSELLAIYAELMWRLQETNIAINYLDEAIELDKSNNTAMWLVREIDNLTSETAKYFNILIMGVWLEPFEGESTKPGFFTSYKVVAEDTEHTLHFIKRFEQPEIHKTIKIEESEILNEKPNAPLGVYETTGYSFFPGEEI